MMKTGHKVAIIVAVITFLGLVVAAIIGNWHNLFSRKEEREAQPPIVEEHSSTPSEDSTPKHPAIAGSSKEKIAESESPIKQEPTHLHDLNQFEQQSDDNMNDDTTQPKYRDIDEPSLSIQQHTKGDQSPTIISDEVNIKYGAPKEKKTKD